MAQLVEQHLRFHGYGSGEWTDSAVRRYVRDAGDQLERLHVLTRADCTTRNQRKADRLRRTYDDLEARIERLSDEEELASIRPDLDGNQIMEILGIGPGREVGEAYRHLLELRLDHGPMSTRTRDPRSRSTGPRTACRRGRYRRFTRAVAAFRVNDPRWNPSSLRRPTDHWPAPETGTGQRCEDASALLDDAGVGEPVGPRPPLGVAVDLDGDHDDDDQRREAADDPDDGMMPSSPQREPPVALEGLLDGRLAACQRPRRGASSPSCPGSCPGWTP